MTIGATSKRKHIMRTIITSSWEWGSEAIGARKHKYCMRGTWQQGLFRIIGEKPTIGEIIQAGKLSQIGMCPSDEYGPEDEFSLYIDLETFSEYNN